MSEHILEKFEVEKADRDLFGFWIYLMSDLITFAALFATFAVLRNKTAGGPSGHELFDLKFILVETVLLLTSSFTCGMAMIGVEENCKKKVLTWFGVTFLLGLAFLGMEFAEFSHLLSEGAGPGRSAFLSSFFGLVGTHGVHIIVGLIWLAIAGIVVWKRGLTVKNRSNLARFSLFWHFLDIVWIFIFTIVYLMGVL